MRAELKPTITRNYGNEPSPTVSTQGNQLIEFKAICLKIIFNCFMLLINRPGLESFVIRCLARDWSMAIEAVLMSFSKSLSLF